MIFAATRRPIAGFRSRMRVTVTNPVFFPAIAGSVGVMPTTRVTRIWPATSSS